MPKLPNDDDWRALIDLVEGNEGRSSCVITNGRPRPSLDMIPVGTAPNLEPLAAVLRADAEIPRLIRDWLASLMMREATSGCWLQLKRSQKPHASVLRHWEAVDHFRDLSGSMHRKEALHQTQIKFKISRSGLEAAIAAIDKAEAEAAAESRK